MMRLLRFAVHSFDGKVRRISASTDSECVVAAMDKAGSSMAPFFANRVAEVEGIRMELVELGIEVEKLSHVPGHTNPADLGTRGDVNLQSLGESSVWQAGPVFLRLPRQEWPLSFAHNNQVPLAELRSKKVVSALLSQSSKQQMDRVRLLVNYCLERGKYERAARTLARIVRAVLLQDRDSINTRLEPRVVEAAKRLMLLSSAAMDKGLLRSLGAQEIGGCVRVSGE